MANVEHSDPAKMRNDSGPHEPNPINGCLIRPRDVGGL